VFHPLSNRNNAAAELADQKAKKLAADICKSIKMDGKYENMLPPQAVLTCLAGHLAGVPSLITLGRDMATKVESVVRGVQRSYAPPANTVLNMATLPVASMGPTLVRPHAPAARLYTRERPPYLPGQRISTCKVAAHVNGMPCEGVLDSGASTCAITLDFLRRTGLDSLVTPTRSNYLNADGRVSQGKGKVPNLVLRLGELETLITPTVTNALNYDVLIGNDVLKRIRAVINYDKSTLTFRADPNYNQELPISTTHPVEPSYYCQDLLDNADCPSHDYAIDDEALYLEEATPLVTESSMRVTEPHSPNASTAATIGGDTKPASSDSDAHMSEADSWLDDLPMSVDNDSEGELHSVSETGDGLVSPGHTSRGLELTYSDCSVHSTKRVAADTASTTQDVNDWLPIGWWGAVRNSSPEHKRLKPIIEQFMYQERGGSFSSGTTPSIDDTPLSDPVFSPRLAPMANTALSRAAKGAPKYTVTTEGPKPANLTPDRCDRRPTPVWLDYTVTTPGPKVPTNPANSPAEANLDTPGQTTAAPLPNPHLTPQQLRERYFNTKYEVDNPPFQHLMEVRRASKCHGMLFEFDMWLADHPAVSMAVGWACEHPTYVTTPSGNPEPLLCAGRGCCPQSMEIAGDNNSPDSPGVLAPNPAAAWLAPHQLLPEAFPSPIEEVCLLDELSWDDDDDSSVEYDYHSPQEYSDGYSDMPDLTEGFDYDSDDSNWAEDPDNIDGYPLEFFSLNETTKDHTTTPETDTEPPSKTTCVPHDDEVVPFPDDGILADNRHLSLSSLVDSSNLTAEDFEQVVSLLEANKDIFCFHPSQLGTCKVGEHVIDTGDAKPIKQNYYRMPYKKQEELKKHIDEWLDAGIIEKSDSAWASPVHLVPKRGGDSRAVIDYRRVNSVTRKDAHPLPRMDDLLHNIGPAKYISTLDLHSGYLQIAIAGTNGPDPHNSRDKTAFVCPFGLFAFNKLSFGLCNGPATFMRVINEVLKDHIGKYCFVYLDDLLVRSNTLSEHLTHLAAIFQSLREAGLMLSTSKCKFATGSAIWGL
jgi:hypothetical protein